MSEELSAQIFTPEQIKKLRDWMLDATIERQTIQSILEFDQVKAQYQLRHDQGVEEITEYVMNKFIGHDLEPKAKEKLSRYVEVYYDKFIAEHYNASQPLRKQEEMLAKETAYGI